MVQTLMLAAWLAGTTAGATTAVNVRSNFPEPPVSFDTVPFWVWNDDMTPEHVTNGLTDFVARGIRSVIIHPRPGLMTPYLGPKWFELWGLALREAESRGLELWIYDENSYPSGFAGGHVPAAMPEARAVNLVAETTPQAPTWQDTIEWVARLTADQAEDVTEAVRRGERLPPGNYLTIRRKTEGRASEWYGGWWYVDLLRPGVAEKFLEITLEPYRQRFGDHFGRTIRGVFTDEPHISGTGGLPWTPDFEAQFRQRRGYELRPHLPALFVPVGPWRKVRHDFYRTAHELFVERWAQPYGRYAEQHRLEMTGHYWEHGWPLARMVPDNMAMYLWMQRPGIDILFNQYAETPNAQFGNIRSVRELYSVTLQAGRPRNLCEAYGGSGWDVRFEDLRRIGDWLLVLGVNTINQHLSHASLRGARKRDYPVSFSYHADWWPLYERQARYFARLQYVLAQGRVPPAAALVLEPTTTTWIYNEGTQPGPRANDIAERFTRLLGDLERAGVEYELGSEDVLARIGTVHDGLLRVGHRVYRVVVLPPGLENLERSTWRLLVELASNGGKVFAAEADPAWIDGEPSNDLAHLRSARGWSPVRVEELVRELAPFHSPGARIVRAPEDSGWLFHARRQTADGEWVFLVNTSTNTPARGVVQASMQGAEEWDADTGEIRPVVGRRTVTGVEIPFELPPVTSRLLFFANHAPAPQPPPQRPPRDQPVPPVDAPVVRRLDPAMWPLDFVELRCGDLVTNLHVVAAADRVFALHGFAKNPWRHAVQFGDRIISHTFPPDSGFTAVYRFVIAAEPDLELTAVIERPDLYTITCNGQPVRALPGEWWLDRSFGKVPLRGTLRAGTNELVLVARPMTVYHEVDQVVLLGDFGLESAPVGWTLVAPRPIAYGPWNVQGLPHYAGRMAYEHTYEIPQAGRYRVRLPAWWGIVAEVRVDGHLAGLIERPPYAIALGPLTRGRHVVQVVVYGTLKNLLGPFHAGVVRGIASPHNMAQAPKTGQPAGAAYDVIPTGLFEPFVLERIE